MRFEQNLTIPVLDEPFQSLSLHRDHLVAPELLLFYLLSLPQKRQKLPLLAGPDPFIRSPEHLLPFLLEPPLPLLQLLLLIPLPHLLDHGWIIFRILSLRSRLEVKGDLSLLLLHFGSQPLLARLPTVRRDRRLDVILADRPLNVTIQLVDHLLVLRSDGGRDEALDLWQVFLLWTHLDRAGFLILDLS